MSVPSSSCLSKLKIFLLSFTTSYSFLPLSRQAAYCIKSSFVTQHSGLPLLAHCHRSCKVPATHDLPASSFFLPLIHLLEELQERGQVLENGSFRSGMWEVIGRHIVEWINWEKCSASNLQGHAWTSHGM